MYIYRSLFHNTFLSVLFYSRISYVNLCIFFMFLYKPLFVAVVVLFVKTCTIFQLHITFNIYKFSIFHIMGEGKVFWIYVRLYCCFLFIFFSRLILLALNSNNLFISLSQHSKQNKYKIFKCKFF